MCVNICIVYEYIRWTLYDLNVVVWMLDIIFLLKKNTKEKISRLVVFSLISSSMWLSPKKCLAVRFFFFTSIFAKSVTRMHVWLYGA